MGRTDTGPASIGQIANACLQPDNWIETFVTQVNPQMRSSTFNVQLHGIGPEHAVYTS